MKTVKPRSSKKQKTEKKTRFVKGMTAGREAMKAVREIVLMKICEETVTRYSKEDFPLIRDMSPLFKMSLIPRIGHLGQVLNSTKKAVLFAFIEEKVKYAHEHESLCDDESLFQERQWCYVSTKSLLATGLFSGRGDVQSSIKWLIDTGLLYDKKRKRDDKSNQVTWYAVEYFHPALVFTRKELLTNEVTTLQEVAYRLLNDEVERGDRAREVLERLRSERKVGKKREPTQ